MSVAAGIEVAGAGNGREGLAYAANGLRGNSTAVGQGTAAANGEGFRSGWRTLIDSLGLDSMDLEPGGPASQGSAAGENPDAQLAEAQTRDSGQDAASAVLHNATLLPSSKMAGGQGVFAAGPVKNPAAGPSQAGFMAGNAIGTLAAGDGAGRGKTSLAAEDEADSGARIKRKADTQTPQRTAPQNLSASDPNTLQIAGSAVIPGTLPALPASSPHVAAEFRESFLSGSPLEPDGVIAGSRAAGHAAAQQETASPTGHRPTNAPGAGIAPSASGSMGAEGWAAAGQGVAVQTSAADEETIAIGRRDAASHSTAAAAPSTGESNRNQIASQPGSNPAAGAGASLSGGQPDHDSQAANAASVAAPPEIAGGGNLRSASGAAGSAFRRLERTRGLAEAAQPGNPSLAPQLAGASGAAGVDSSILARGLTGAHGAGAAFHQGAASADGAGSDARETFSALDAGSDPGTMSWVHAGAQSAEAGFQDPALGWVGVRADLSGGAVHAAVVAGSSDAARTLGGHMAGLNAYLADHHAGVASLTMASPDNGSANWSGNSGAMQQGASGNNPQSGAPEPQTNGSFSPAAASGKIPAQSGGLEAAPPEVRQGRHISVMA